MNSKKQAWAVLSATFLAGVAVAVNQFKVPPVLPVLMAELGVDMVVGGWLASSVSLASLLLAIPTAYLLARVGLRFTGVFALSCTLAGSVLGALSSSAGSLLLSRTIEGIGIGLIAVASPAAISAWFPPQERGLPMGIWASWVPLGNVIAFNVAHPLMRAFDWRANWWFGALCALAAALYYAAVVREPEADAAQSVAPSSRRGGGTAPSPANGFGQHLLNPASWILALAFGAFAFSMLATITWTPAYLMQSLGAVAPVASFVGSLAFLAEIPANLVAGWAINQTQRRYRLLTLSYLFAPVLFSLAFRLGSVSLVALHMLSLGVLASFVVTSVFTLAPSTMDRPQLAGLGLGIAMVGSGLGSLSGAPVLGAVISNGGWPASSVCLVLATAVGLSAAVVAWRRARVGTLSAVTP